MAEVLLKHGADVNYGLPLWDAVERNAVAMAEVLLKHGADVNAAENSGLTPLSVAMRENAVTTEHILRSYGGHE